MSERAGEERVHGVGCTCLVGEREGSLCVMRSSFYCVTLSKEAEKVIFVFRVMVLVRYAANIGDMCGICG